MHVGDGQALASRDSKLADRGTTSDRSSQLLLLVNFHWKLVLHLLTGSDSRCQWGPFAQVPAVRPVPSIPLRHARKLHEVLTNVI